MNLNEIKAFMFDMDGTLVNRSCIMPENTKKALRILKEKGYPLIINSGRPTFSSIKVIDSTGTGDLFEYYYGCNGIEFFNRKTDEGEFIASLSEETIKDFDKIFHEDYLALCFYDNGDTLMMNHFTNDMKQIEDWAKLRYVNAKEYDFQNIDGPKPKMIILFDADKKEEVTKKFRAIKDDRVDMFFSGKDVIEIVPKGSNKGDAVKAFAKKLGISEKQIMCFGDAENDMPALTLGTGVYLGKKEEALKYNIEYSIKSVDEDGLYLFLEESGLLK